MQCIEVYLSNLWSWYDIIEKNLLLMVRKLKLLIDSMKKRVIFRKRFGSWTTQLECVSIARALSRRIRARAYAEGSAL